MYADDHQIYQTGKGISTVHTKLEESASSATDWYENNLLEGNLKKYQTMFIQNKYGHMKEQFSCTEHNTNLNLNCKIIRTSDSLKILGVTISQFGVSKNTCARRDKKKHIFFFFCHAKYTHEFALKKICIFKICLILSRRAHVFFETPN